VIRPNEDDGTGTVRIHSLADLDRAFAAATRLVRGSARVPRLVFDVARAARGPLFAQVFRSWLARRAPELRARVGVVELHVPSWLSALWMRLEMFAAPPPIPVAVSRANMRACSTAAMPR
jgi:hypothetical protein